MHKAEAPTVPLSLNDPRCREHQPEEEVLEIIASGDRFLHGVPAVDSFHPTHATEQMRGACVGADATQ